MQVTKTKFMTTRKGQAGFSLLELSIVLLIGGIALYAVLGSGNENQESLKMQQEATNMKGIDNGLKDYFKNRSDTSSASNTVLLQASPASKISGTSVRNEFGGVVTLAKATVTSTDDAFAITSPSYPQKACLKVVPDLQYQFTVIKVNGTVVKSAIQQQVVDATLQTACTTGNSNSIEYTSRKP